MNCANLIVSVLPCPRLNTQLFDVDERARSLAQNHTTERAASMQRGVAAGTTDRGSAEEGGGSGSSDSDESEDGNTDLSSDDELALPPPRQGNLIPASLSTVWAKRWGSSVPAAGLYPVAPLADGSPTARQQQPAAPVKPVSAWGGCGARVCAALDSLLAAIPIALLSYATSTSYAMLIVEGARPLTRGGLSAELVVAMQLLGSALSGIAHARGSGSRYTIASGDVSVAVFYGTWVSHVYNDDAVPDEDKHATAMVAMCLMTAVSSLLYLLIGAARAADMVQYVPFPVVAGFLGMAGSSNPSPNPDPLA
jgi:hypothetical protein